MFEPVLSAGEVDRLLVELERADTRAKAEKKLSACGQGHIDRIIAFAHDCPDREAREACADVVEALDSAYRTTEPGKRLGVLYRQRAETLLPAAWARFRSAPFDRKAVAMLVHADPRQTYAFLGKTPDRHDRVRYLLLRIRELGADQFAAERLEDFSAPAVLWAMPDVFPYAADHVEPGLYGRVYRVVGHTYLRAFRLFASADFQWPDASVLARRPNEPQTILPKVYRADFVRRWVGVLNTKWFGVAFHAVGVCRYGGRTVHTVGGATLPHTSAGLCPLPEVQLPENKAIFLWMGQFPWWAKDVRARGLPQGNPLPRARPGERAPRCSRRAFPRGRRPPARDAAGGKGVEAFGAKRGRSAAGPLRRRRSVGNRRGRVALRSFGRRNHRGRRGARGGPQPTRSPSPGTESPGRIAAAHAQLRRHGPARIRLAGVLPSRG